MHELRIWGVAAWFLLGGCGSGNTMQGAQDARGAADASVRVDAAAGPADSGAHVDADAPRTAHDASATTPQDASAPPPTVANDASIADAATPASPTLAVAVGYGTRRVRSKNGVNWTDFQQVSANGMDDDDNLRGVGYGDGVFVAVGGANNGLSMTSTDGATWENEHRDLSGWLGDVVYLNGVFVAAGGNGLRVRSTDKGKSWSDATPYASEHFRAIAAGNGVAVAVGHTYGQNPDQGISSVTADGVTWSATQRAGAPLRSIAFGNGVFVALGDGGACAVSSDGKSWTRTTLSGANASVAFARGEFLVARQGGYYRSADGKTWTQTASASARDVVAEFQGMYMAVGWPASISSSTDLKVWNTVWSVGGSGMNQIAVGQ